MPELDTLRSRVFVGQARSRTRASVSWAVFLCVLLLRRWRGSLHRATWSISREQLRIHSALVGVATLLAVGAMLVAGSVAAVIVGIFSLGGLWLFPLPALRQLEKLKEGTAFEAPVSWRDRWARRRSAQRRLRFSRRPSVRLRRS
jgi:glutathione S-transferase